MRENTETPSPADSCEEKWYRQFWPWFLIAILGSGLIGCIITIVIAQNNPPTVIRHDINRFGQVDDSPRNSPSSQPSP